MQGETPNWTFLRYLREEPVNWFYFFKEQKQVDPVFAIAVLLLIPLAFLLWYVRRDNRKLRRAREVMRHVHEVASEDRLSEGEERALLHALRKARLADPRDGIDSAEYFDIYIAPILKKRTTEDTCASIRAKLFERTEPSPKPEGPEKLHSIE